MERTLPEKTFLDVPVVSDDFKLDTRYAYIGIPYGPPYDLKDLSVCEKAADAVREVSHRMGYITTFHYDFDLGQELFTDEKPNITDCGDVVGDVRDPDAIWDKSIGIVKKIYEQGSVPIVIGALDAIPPIPVAAYADQGPINVLHVDAHLDFRHEVKGVTRGYSNHIRRIREFDHVERIVQIGLRSMGSARPNDVRDALASGNELHTAWQIHEEGIEKVIHSVGTEGKWIVTIDLDGLDPSIAPGVGWPEPGGLTFPQIGQVIRHLARHDMIAGLIFTEFQPAEDYKQTTANTIARLIVNTIGIQR